ncbi:MAG: hypothetical protein M3447_04810, partial [Acidobacteriota bacterium]|nr:hypothetical protein [Acidobacteriota bacterium]
MTDTRTPISTSDVATRYGTGAVATGTIADWRLAMPIGLCKQTKRKWQLEIGIVIGGNRSRTV